MYDIKRVLVGVDLSDQDDVILQFISQLNDLISLDHIYFIHVANDLDLSPEILQKYPDLLAPVDESIKRNIEFSIKQHFNNTDNLNYDILIQEGNIAKNIIKAAHQKQIDLVILGRTRDEISNMGLLRKVVRLVPCSVALVPTDLPSRIKNILIPVDFSDYSALAVQQGAYIASNHPEAKLECLHLYHVPHGYSKTGKSYEEFSAIMRSNAMKDANDFVQKYNLDQARMNFSYHLNKDGDLAKSIFQYAVTYAASLIVIGSKGRTRLSSILLGSVAEHLIEYDQFLPILVVKDKKAEFDVFEAIKII